MALVIAMLVMAVLLLAGTTFLTISSTESQIAYNQQVSVRGFLLAETGIQRAIAMLNADVNYAGESNVSLSGGAVTIGVVNSPQQVCVSRDLAVTASIPVRGGVAQSEIRATVDRVVYPFRWGAFAANGNLNLSSLSWSTTPRSAVDSFDSRNAVYSDASKGPGGNIGSTQGTVLYYVDVQGGVMGPTWMFPATGTLLGDMVDASFPMLPAPSVVWATDPNVAASTTLSLSAGTYYLSSLTLGDGSQIVPSGGPVTIYIQGNILAGNGVTLGAQSGDRLMIIANSGSGLPSEFRTGNNFQLFGAFYGTNTKIVIGDGSTIYGSMIGRRIAGPYWGSPDEPLYNNIAPSIHYDRSLADQPVCASSFTVRRGTWREVYP